MGMLGFGPGAYAGNQVNELVDRLGRGVDTRSGKPAPDPNAPTGNAGFDALRARVGTMPGTATTTTQKAMTPSQGFEALLKAFLGSGMPQYAGDLATYQGDLVDWSTGLSTAMEGLQRARELELGVLRLEDGTLIDVHDPAITRDPNTAQQVAALFANQDAEVMNAYYDMLNKLDLAEYADVTARTNQNNATLSRGFQDAMERFTNAVALGQADQNTAVRRVDRQLQGLQESRARASEAEDQLSAAAGLATQPGKTSFSSADLGGAVSGLARLAGLDPSAALLNFTGTREVNPFANFAAGDQALGVGGPLEAIPDIGVDRAMMPQAPSYAFQGAGPQLRRPVAPTLAPRLSFGPQAAAPAMQTAPTLEQLASVADTMGP